MSHDLLPTAVVGSYPQPDWLIDRERLSSEVPPRVRLREIWRIDPDRLEEAQDDATRVALRDMEEAGIDIVTDGEIRRESYSNRFATALDGLDIDNPGEVAGRTGRTTLVPRVVGPIRRRAPVQVRDVSFARAHTDRTLKATVPGPFTMAMQSLDEHYGSAEAMAMDYAAAVNEELHDLFAAGADIVQLDEPWLQSRTEYAKNFGVEAINRALAGAPGPTTVHICFGYGHMVKDKPAGYSFLPELDAVAADHVSIEAAQPALDLSILGVLPSKTVLVGVIDLGSAVVESVETVAGRIRRALEHIPADRLVVAPDCGMKYLPRAAAFGKLEAMTEAAARVRAEIG